MEIRNLTRSVVAIGVIGFGSLLAPGTLADQKPDRSKIIALMYQKLAYQKQMLEAIVKEDYDSVAKASDALIVISREATWQSLRTPGFQNKAKSFQFAAEDLRNVAATKDMDRVALPYVRLTLSCVECHALVHKP